MTFANSHAAKSALSDAGRQTDDRAAPGRPPRQVCVIGNSFIGALFRAYRDGLGTDGYAFSFFASAGPKFEHIDFDGQAIVKALITSGGSTDLTLYDCFVIHGDLPAAHDAAKYAREMPEARYSEQVRRFAMRQQILKSKSARLSQTLSTITDKPIFLLSRNLNQPLSVGPEADSDEGAALIAREIAPATYIPFPPALFSEDRYPKAEYYNGSLDVFGEEPDRVAKAGHEISHFNKDGGVLMLAHIVEYLRKS